MALGHIRTLTKSCPTPELKILYKVKGLGFFRNFNPQGRSPKVSALAAALQLQLQAST